jgi:hypothetical protein
MTRPRGKAGLTGHLQINTAVREIRFIGTHLIPLMTDSPPITDTQGSASLQYCHGITAAAGIKYRPAGCGNLKARQ